MTKATSAGRKEPDIEQWIAELHRCCDILADAPTAPLDRDFREAHDILSARMNISASSPRGAAILRHPAIEPLSQRLASVNAAYHRSAELAKARAYLSQATARGDPFEDSWLSPGFAPLLRGQVGRWRRLGLFSKAGGRPIVVVGGGALPQSQVMLHRATGRTVIGVEQDAESASTARELLARMEFGPELAVVHADGCDFDYSGAFIVVVATLVAKKAVVAEQVGRTAPDAFLNVRTPTGLHRLWRIPLEPEVLRRMHWATLDRWSPRAASLCALTCVRQIEPRP